MGKTRAVNNKKTKKIVIVTIAIILLIILALILNEYIILGKNKKINLVINNNNITNNLKNDILIENNIIYLSEPDIQNFFDNYIYQIDNMVVTTYDKKIAEIGFENNTININGSDVKIKAGAKNENGQVYLPISEMKDIYGIDIEYNEDTKIIIMDSLDREQKKCTVKKNLAVKSSRNFISKTIARVRKGESVVKIKDMEDGWTRVRTADGRIGFIKTKKLDNEITVRQDMGEEKQVEGKINLIWDYFSESKEAPDRVGTRIDGVNVVSPSFFHLTDKGEIMVNIGGAGEKYIQWAHANGYKVWPMFSNAGENMMDVTSEIMNDYNKRKQIIENISDLCVEYNLDGINVDFENMKQEDIDLFSRFIIELTPRLKENGDVTSVDVTAPDGGETWSLCFDRHIIGNVADYIVFMGYDQYGTSSTKAGTTAGYDWVKLSLEKFLTTEEISSDKIILGIPFYTRLWAEGDDGKATSKIVNMKDIDSTLPQGIKAKWDDELKQKYVEYENKGFTMKMWVEDEDSLKQKLSLITENNLTGVAEWQKGMETENIWQIIKQELNK